MNPQAHIKVVLIDDHALVRDGIRALLMAVPELDVVGEAGSGAEAFDLLKRVPADVVLMDIGLKDINGLELTQSLRRDFPDIRVLILSMYDNQEYVNTSVKVGARGYVLKDAPSREIIVAIEAIAAGGTYYSEGVAEKLANHSAEERELTPREREVLLMLAQGHNNKTMARALQISVRTVETHRLSIRRKLDIDRPAGRPDEARDGAWLATGTALTSTFGFKPAAVRYVDHRGQCRARGSHCSSLSIWMRPCLPNLSDRSRHRRWSTWHSSVAPGPWPGGRRSICPRTNWSRTRVGLRSPLASC